MKKIFWRVLVYFGVVLIVFTVLIGMVFTRFNRTNIIKTYKKQIGGLAASVARQTSQAAKDGDNDKFQNYLRSIEDYAEMQDIDVWVISCPEAKEPLSEDFTNVDILSVDIPDKTYEILESAYSGKKKSYSAFDDIYKKTMLHFAMPVYNNRGYVIGAVLVSGPMRMQENIIIQYEKYLLLSVATGLLLALLLALYFSSQLSRPIIRIKESALILAAGHYGYKTGVERKDEIGSLAESMDVLSDRLVEAEKLRQGMEQTRRDFFSNVSHELRTPITVMKGYADTLADGSVDNPGKQQEYLLRIRRECDSMEKLVSDLLILSRMQNPDFELNKEVLNVIAVAQDAMRSLRILMKEQNMTGVVEFEDACCLMDGDYDRIRQLFVILLQNAVKYGQEGSEIQVVVWHADGRVNAQVKNYGSIIPKEELEHVFEKFYRASNREEKDGSGLGLVVADHIVKRHDGEISVSSSEEEGTCFLVTFPETPEKFLSKTTEKFFPETSKNIS